MLSFFAAACACLFISGDKRNDVRIHWFLRRIVGSRIAVGGLDIVADYTPAMFMTFHMLLQAAPPPAPSGGSPTSIFTNIFWLTIGFIFLSAIIGAIIARRRKDRCLKLLDEYHVTMVLTSGRVIWGDLNVFAQGMEITFDAPYQTQLDFIKSGYMLYEPEMPQLSALIRHAGDLTDRERARRQNQVAARFRPGLLRRIRRTILNVFNTIRDAFTQALGAFIGHVATTTQSTVMQTQRGHVEKIGQNVLGYFGNAYEPMLERHIGKPVVLELQSPADPAKRPISLPGYLAEYSDRFVALFNVEQNHRERIELSLDQPIDREDLKIDTSGGGGGERIAVTNKSLVPVIIEAMRSDTGEVRRLGMVLTNGATVRLPRRPGKLTLEVMRMLHLDVVAPRSQAVVRFASVLEMPQDVRGNLPPAGEGASG